MYNHDHPELFDAGIVDTNEADLGGNGAYLHTPIEALRTMLKLQMTCDYSTRGRVVTCRKFAAPVSGLEKLFDGEVADGRHDKDTPLELTSDDLGECNPFPPQSVDKLCVTKDGMRVDLSEDAGAEATVGADGKDITFTRVGQQNMFIFGVRVRWGQHGESDHRLGVLCIGILCSKENQPELRDFARDRLFDLQDIADDGYLDVVITADDVPEALKGDWPTKPVTFRIPVDLNAVADELAMNYVFVGVPSGSSSFTTWEVLQQDLGSKSAPDKSCGPVSYLWAEFSEKRRGVTWLQGGEGAAKALREGLIVYDLLHMRDIYTACARAVAEGEEPAAALDVLPDGVPVLRATTASDPGYLVPNVVLAGFEEKYQASLEERKEDDQEPALDKVSRQQTRLPTFLRDKGKIAEAKRRLDAQKKHARRACRPVGEDHAGCAVRFAPGVLRRTRGRVAGAGMGNGGRQFAPEVPDSRVAADTHGVRHGREAFAHLTCCSHVASCPDGIVVCG